MWAPLPSDRLNALRKLISENRKVEEAAIQKSQRRREESYGVGRTLVWRIRRRTENVEWTTLHHYGGKKQRGHL